MVGGDHTGVYGREYVIRDHSRGKHAEMVLLSAVFLVISFKDLRSLS